MNTIDIINRLNSGETLASVAKEQGVHRTTLSRNLKKEGYDKINEVWVNTNGEDLTEQLEEAPEAPIEEEVVATTEEEGEPEVNSHEVHTGFTLEEVEALREMLKAYKETTSSSSEDDSIYNKIGNLHQVEKTRKTIVISSNIAEELDAFCDKKNVQKSDIIHLALRELFDKYKDA